MASESNISPNARQDKKCDICFRCFARSEHLARHRLTHTKEKPFTCPHCRRSFQRSDVRAVHLKKCNAAPPDHSNGDSGKKDSARKRVRIACDNCRKKKMRCDGNEPCASCLSIGSPCHYKMPTASASAPSHASHTDTSADTYPDQNIGDFNVSVSNNENTAPLDFPLQQAGLHDASSLNHGLDFGTSLDPDFHALQSDSQNVLNSEFSGQTGISVYDNMNSDEPHMSISHENVLYQLPDANDMRSYWQMPSVNAQFWFGGFDFAGNDGFFDSNSPLLDHVLSSQMQNLTASMQEYFDRKSRAPSPSLNKASKMWYSAPPNLDDHNKDVVSVFLKIFQKHIPETFALFKNTAIGQKGRAAYTLAVAATGGLFCTVPGSAEVAKSMYNDARRLLLASFNIKNVVEDSSANPEDKLVTVKTFILLELYGLCSGDKRSYEFVEAFHGNLIDSVQEYSQACKAAEVDSKRQEDRLLLLETLYILDCYRVIIMQCPPSLSWHHPDSFAEPSSPADPIYQLHRLVAQLTDGGRISDAYISSEFSLASLAYTSAFLWPAIYPRQNRYGIDNVVIESLTLWKGDFVEVAFDTWLRSNGQATDPSHLAVYHMMNLMLHTNLNILQSFAHSAPGSVARDPKKSLAAREIHAWTQSRHYNVARWHADHMIAAIESSFTAAPSRLEQPSLRQPPTRSSSSTLEPRRLPFEAPHVPYAVYFATLIVWCGEITEETTAPISSCAQASIARGERILSFHKVHIAQLLARVLNEVK